MTITITAQEVWSVGKYVLAGGVGVVVGGLLCFWWFVRAWEGTWI